MSKTNTQHGMTRRKPILFRHWVPPLLILVFVASFLMAPLVLP